MGICVYNIGKKSPTAPDVITFREDLVCYMLGQSNGLCSFLDRLFFLFSPSFGIDTFDVLVWGVTKKSKQAAAAIEVMRKIYDSLGLIWQVNTVIGGIPPYKIRATDFCKRVPPTPPTTTPSQYYQLIYTSLFTGNYDDLLDKLFEDYAYELWLANCECDNIIQSLTPSFNQQFQFNQNNYPTLCGNVTNLSVIDRLLVSLSIDRERVNNVLSYSDIDLVENNTNYGYWGKRIGFVGDKVMGHFGNGMLIDGLWSNLLTDINFTLLFENGCYQPILLYRLFINYSTKSGSTGRVSLEWAYGGHINVPRNILIGRVGNGICANVPDLCGCKKRKITYKSFDDCENYQLKEAEYYEELEPNACRGQNKRLFRSGKGCNKFDADIRRLIYPVN